MEHTRIDPAAVRGWGVDNDPANDPTFPMRERGGDDKSGLSWERPPLQPDLVEVLMSTEHGRRPAVYGTSTPPSGLSGIIRRRAFRRSEGKWGHWLMLMMADRIDVVEGLGEDLRNGIFPNIFAEMGHRAQWRYNRGPFLLKIVLTLAVIGLILAALVLALS